jgi:signal transduction histidine kinase
MFVQITKEEFSKEVLKKAWYQTNNIIWTLIFLYPLLVVVDFIYATDYWVQFLIVRIITVLVILGSYTFFKNNKYNYRILLHCSFFLVSCTSAIFCNLVPTEHLTVYCLVYSAVLLFFNIQVFWEPVHSIVQSLAALVLLSVFFNTLNSGSAEQFINNGGQFFFIIASISCLIPGARFKVLEREARQQLQIEKSNEQLKAQNQDIVEKNRIIDVQYERMLKMDEQKNSFINIAGHDLKNLIGSIVMSANMIKDEEYRLSTDQREFLGYITESAEKMQYMLNKLMDVKEIESPELKFNMEIFDINVEVRRIFRGLIETAQMKNIHLMDHILKLPLNVKLDKVFAGQVFQNLLSNAIKFSQTNNTIKVITGLQRQKFVFEIIDEGIAIGQDELDMMFSKLQTLNDASTSPESRLGLGLSIAKLITREMGGELFYRSDENGNYFRVEFNVIN